MVRERTGLRVFVSLCAGLVAAFLLGGCDSGRTDVQISPRAAHYFQKAERAYRAGAYTPALMLADSLQKEEPNFSGVYMLRGQIYTALDRYEDAAEQLSRAAAIDPDNPAVAFNRATNAYRREQYREAIRRFETVLEMIEGRERVNIYAGDKDGREAQYAALLQMGRAYDDLGIADSSRMRYERAIELAPQNAEAYYSMSGLYEKLGAFDEAITYARRALERAPDRIEYKYGLGVLLVQSGQYRKAIPYLEAVAAARPWHHGSHYNLGQAYMHLDKSEQAEQYLAHADSLQQAHAQLEKLGEQAEVSTNNPRLWIDYGNALRKAGRIDDAKKAFRHVMMLVPGNVALQNNMAILAIESGDTTEAIMRYRAMLRRDSTLTDVWLNLGATYANSGRTEMARRAWENVLEYDPDHAAAKRYIAEYASDDSE